MPGTAIAPRSAPPVVSPIGNPASMPTLYPKLHAWILALNCTPPSPTKPSKPKTHALTACEGNLYVDGSDDDSDASSGGFKLVFSMGSTLSSAIQNGASHCLDPVLPSHPPASQPIPPSGLQVSKIVTGGSP